MSTVTHESDDRRRCGCKFFFGGVTGPGFSTHRFRLLWNSAAIFSFSNSKIESARCFANCWALHPVDSMIDGGEEIHLHQIVIIAKML